MFPSVPDVLFKTCTAKSRYPCKMASVIHRA
jgi:hypothetical protein